jgi:adenylate cyclase class IV
MDTAKNVEVKAQILSQEEFDRKLAIARSLTGTNGSTVKQHDVFFNSKNGMLKLRYIEVSFY